MKKKILVLSLILLLCTVAIGGTLAYFNAEETAHNVITSGGVDIDLQEWADADMTIPFEEMYPDNKVENVMPGQTVEKVVVVKNLEADAYIRAGYAITIVDADKNVMQVPEEELAKVIKIETGEGWTEKDGLYYYTGAIGAGETTTPLFCEVVFDGPNMTNEYQNCTFTIDVNAQAVQVANNGETALEALGWE